jgi:hypothetical protein
MVSLTRRTAGCGPAYPVVWQGRVGDHSPYADHDKGFHNQGQRRSRSKGAVAGNRKERPGLKKTAPTRQPQYGQA